MALEFRLPNGGLQHITMINTPMFFAAVPRTFLDKMRALKPDPATGKPDPETFKAFLDSHPDNRGQAEFLADNNPPASYADRPSSASIRSSSSIGTTKSLWCAGASSPRTEKSRFPMRN
jgi:catalase